MILILAQYSESISVINNRDSGHTLNKQMAQIKKYPNQIMGELNPSCIEALCTAGNQEAQHLNKGKNVWKGGEGEWLMER